MLLTTTPHYTYSFGSFGKSLETTLQTHFFTWFHLEETERHADPPVECIRFRPSGDKFHDLCYLDILITPTRDLVATELVIQRSFLDSRDAPFAQDLIKSFLQAVLPDACRSKLEDFLSNISLDPLDTLTGWTHLQIANLSVNGSPSLVIHTSANPTAPNAVLVS